MPLKKTLKDLKTYAEIVDASSKIGRASCRERVLVQV